MIEALILILGSFFAMNMGAPSFASSFSTAVGTKALSRKTAAFCFLLFSVIGASLLGGAVAKTLGKSIIPNEIIDSRAVVIILFTATLSLFTANMMKIPQSTSLSTIAAICGVGAHFNKVFWGKIQHLAFWWAIFTCISFILVYCATRYTYPPKKRNFWIYEKILNNRKRLSWLVIFSSCYQGFSQGTNNVANAVGPMMSASVLDQGSGLLIMGLFFGAGAFIFLGPMETSSEKIVPLGLLTATIINLIIGTINISASCLGLPLPAVIVYTVSIYAIGSVKNGARLTLKNPLTRKTFFTWLINPFITFFLAFILTRIFVHN